MHLELSIKNSLRVFIDEVELFHGVLLFTGLRAGDARFSGVTIRIYTAER